MSGNSVISEDIKTIDIQKEVLKLLNGLSVLNAKSLLNNILRELDEMAIVKVPS